MGLKFDDLVVEKMEEIYAAQDKPPLYKWSIDLNAQLEYLKIRIRQAGIDLTVTKVRQNCDNMCFTIDGDLHHVAWMDMALLGWSYNKGCQHLLILEHVG